MKFSVVPILISKRTTCDTIYIARVIRIPTLFFDENLKRPSFALQIISTSSQSTLDKMDFGLAEDHFSDRINFQQGHLIMFGTCTAIVELYTYT